MRPRSPPPPPGAVGKNIDTWRLRRRFLFGTNLLCWAVIVYCIGWKVDTAVAERAVDMSYITIIASLGSYVFAAAWEDISRRRDTGWGGSWSAGGDAYGQGGSWSGQGTAGGVPPPPTYNNEGEGDGPRAPER